MTTPGRASVNTIVTVRRVGPRFAIQPRDDARFVKPGDEDAWPPLRFARWAFSVEPEEELEPPPARPLAPLPLVGDDADEVSPTARPERTFAPSGSPPGRDGELVDTDGR